MVMRGLPLRPTGSGERKSGGRTVMVTRGLALQPTESRERKRRREQKQEICDLWVPLKSKRKEEKVDQWKVSLFLRVIFIAT